MTKVIILGQEPKEEKKLKPIEFVKAIPDTGKLQNPNYKPSEFENIELICKNYYHEDFDLMFAYDLERSRGCLYLGHFNDGVTE